MSQPQLQPSFLALPSFSQSTPPTINSSLVSSATASPTNTGLHLPARTTTTTTPKKRKLANANGKTGKQSRSKSGVNDSKILDERDDVDDADLVAGGDGGALRGLDEDYDEDEEGEGGGAVVDDGDEEETGGDTVPDPALTTSGGGVLMGGTRAAPTRAGARKNVAASMGIDVAGVIAKGKAMKGDQMALRDTLDPEDAKRFDAFSSAVMSSKAIKKLNRDMFDRTFADKDRTPAFLAGLAKIFVAEVVEIAKDIQPHTDHPTGPLQTYHLKLARQVLEERGMLGATSSRENASLRPKKSVFRR